MPEKPPPLAGGGWGRGVTAQRCATTKRLWHQRSSAGAATACHANSGASVPLTKIQNA